MSAGGSIGGGKGEEEQTSEAGSMLQEIMGAFASETTPLRQELLRQFMTVLTTGSVGGQFGPQPTTTGSAPTQASGAPAPMDGGKGGDLASLFGISDFGGTPTISRGDVRMELPSGRSSVPGTPIEAPATGGSTALIPIVSRALESSLRAGSRATEETESDLARSDLLGTPFGEQILSSTKREGAHTASQIPTNFAAQIFSMIPNFLLGQGQTVASGLGAAVPGNVENKGRQVGFGGSLGIG